jgi:hypothetical protein
MFLSGGMKVKDFLRDMQVSLKCRDKILMVERSDTKEVTQQQWHYNIHLFVTILLMDNIACMMN